MKFYRSLILFLFCQYGIAQGESTFRVIVYPANKKNEAIYNLSKKQSFCNLISQYIQKKHSPYFLDLQLMYEEDFTNLIQDYKEVKIESVQSPGYLPEKYFFSSKMDLYIFQEKDPVSNIFQDIIYEFRINGRTQYPAVIRLSVAELDTRSLFNIQSIIQNKELFSLQYECRFDEEKNRQSFNYYFINNMDLDILHQDPPESVRISQYSADEMHKVSGYQQYFLEDLKQLFQTGKLGLKSKYDEQFRAIDTSYGRNPFRYALPGPLVHIISVSGKDSVITMPNGDQLVQYHPRKEFDLENKHLQGVRIYERGIFNTESKTWLYEPYAVSPVFIADGQDVQNEYEHYWIILSDLKAIKSQMNESTYRWFESVQELQQGKVLFKLEPAFR